MTALLLLLLQGSWPTVGDTIWIARTLGEVPGAVVRPQPWALEPSGSQLGPAEVSQGSGGVTVRYPVVLWYPGEQVLTMPGPVLVRADGTSDTLAASMHRVRVQSVLPAGVPRPRLEPRPPRTPVPLSSRSLLPLLVLMVGVGLATGLAAVLWRRKGPSVSPRMPVLVEPSPELLQRWARAGEYRAALTGWGWKLARRMARSSDLAEIAEVQRTLDEIGTTAFRPARREQLAELSARAAALGSP